MSYDETCEIGIKNERQYNNNSIALWTKRLPAKTHPVTDIDETIMKENDSSQVHQESIEGKQYRILNYSEQMGVLEYKHCNIREISFKDDGRGFTNQLIALSRSSYQNDDGSFRLLPMFVVVYYLNSDADCVARYRNDVKNQFVVVAGNSESGKCLELLFDLFSHLESKGQSKKLSPCWIRADGKLVGAHLSEFAFAFLTHMVRKNARSIEDVCKLYNETKPHYKGLDKTIDEWVTIPRIVMHDGCYGKVCDEAA